MPSNNSKMLFSKTTTNHAKNMKRYSLLFFALTVSLLGYAQTTVLPFTPGITPEGITYYLPKTELSVTITATRTTQIPGDLNAYAKHYLKLNNVTQEKETEWKIDKVEVIPFGTPDTSKVYSIPLKKSTIAPLVSLTKSGLILSVNKKTDEEANPQAPNIDKTEKSNLNPRDYMSQEILQAGNTTKMAELTANEIYDIRESRSELSKGQADNLPKDGEQLKIMLNQLNTQETALLQLFKGTTETETKTFTLTYYTSQNQKKAILCRFSDQKGIVGKDNLVGEPVYIDITDMKTIPAEQTDGKKKKTEEQSVRYNIPSDVNVKIYTREDKLVDITTPMAQFGKVEILSSELFNKRTDTQVLFQQTTGGIKEVTNTAETK